MPILTTSWKGWFKEALCTFHNDAPIRLALDKIRDSNYILLAWHGCKNITGKSIYRWGNELITPMQICMLTRKHGCLFCLQCGTRYEFDWTPDDTSPIALFEQLVTQLDRRAPCSFPGSDKDPDFED